MPLSCRHRPSAFFPLADGIAAPAAPQSKGLIHANVIDQDAKELALQVPDGLLPEVTEHNMIRQVSSSVDRLELHSPTPSSSHAAGVSGVTSMEVEVEVAA